MHLTSLVTCYKRRLISLMSSLYDKLKSAALLLNRKTHTVGLPITPYKVCTVKKLQLVQTLMKIACNTLQYYYEHMQESFHSKASQLQMFRTV